MRNYLSWILYKSSRNFTWFNFDQDTLYKKTVKKLDDTPFYRLRLFRMLPAELWGVVRVVEKMQETNKTRQSLTALPCFINPDK
jgi:hypothetical protein